LRGVRARRPKTIATYHQPAELLDSLVMRRVVRSLDAVTVVAPEQLPYFDGLLPNERVRMILHGIDVHFFHPPVERPPSDTLRCITVGHHLRDFRAIRGVAELLAGDERFRFDVVSSQARELAGIPNVETYSGLDDAELLRLYQRADVLFLPLLQSTANNALLEGIACGLPVVSTQLPSVKAYVPGAEAVLIEANEAEAFATILRELADDRTRREAMGKQARARAEELAWEKVGPEYARLYDELMER
ncbi:MAG TPA: glycosyltransferase family 4 protein, partial [Gemmatimonadaceae bacterium]|nr:glycosyltransferase family 4 protein [Gemmatimonadaceae bacterium]